jgi:hypothetical protein
MVPYQQPVGNVKKNTENMCSDGLVFAYLPGKGDVIGRIPGNSPPLTYNGNGPYLNVAGSSANSWLSTSTYTPTSIKDRTIVFWAKAVANTGYVVAHGLSGEGGWALLTIGDAIYYGFPGVAFAVFSTAINSEGWYAVTATSANVIRVFKNRAFSEQQSFAGDIFTANAAKWCVGNESKERFPWTSAVGPVLVWYRCMSDAEVLDVLRDPMQVFVHA